MDSRSESSSSPAPQAQAACGEGSSRSSYGLRGQHHRPPASLGKRAETAASGGKKPVTSHSLQANTKASNTTTKNAPAAATVASPKAGIAKAATSKSAAMSSEPHRIVRSGSVKPARLCPRREFGPAQDFPARQYSLKYSGGRPRPQPASKDVLSKVLTTKVSSNIQFYKSKL